MLIYTVFVALLIGFSIGIAVGSKTTEHHLTSYPVKGVSGPHCIRGNFWYVVPEGMWNRIYFRNMGIQD